MLLAEAIRIGRFAFSFAPLRCGIYGQNDSISGASGNVMDEMAFIPERLTFEEARKRLYKHIEQGQNLKRDGLLDTKAHFDYLVVKRG
jgi:hypothetical protein